LFRLRRYIKHSGQCFTGYPITSNFVRNTQLRVVFSTLFSVFEYPDDTPSLVFDMLHEEGATSRFKHREKFISFVVCNPCQSSPSLTILVPLWFIIISLVFSCLNKLLFSGFLQCKGTFVRGQKAVKSSSNPANIS